MYICILFRFGIIFARHVKRKVTQSSHKNLYKINSKLNAY